MEKTKKTKKTVLVLLTAVLLFGSFGCRRAEEKADVASPAPELPACDYSQISGVALDYIPLWSGVGLDTEDVQTRLQSVYVPDTPYLRPAVYLISDGEMLRELVDPALDKLSDQEGSVGKLYKKHLEELKEIGDKVDFESYSMLLAAYKVDGIYTELDFNSEAYKPAYTSGLPVGAVIKYGNTLKIAVVDDYTDSYFLGSIVTTFSVGCISKENAKLLSDITTAERITVKP